jgi:SPOR domain
MKQSILFTLIYSTILLFGACSSSKESTDEKGNDVYVFDEVPLNDSDNTQTKTDEFNYNFFVQIGAFTTRTTAKEFTEKSKQILNEEFEVVYNEETELYAVRLKNIFGSRVEAETVRNQIRQNEDYADAWIVQKLK